MSEFALMALLGLTVFLPLFVDDDASDGDIEEVDPDAPVDPVDPVEPTDTEVGIDGTDDADTLTAQSGETVNGLGGNDVMTTAPGSDGATINGGEGNDSLDLAGVNATARGGAGDDTISSFDILNGAVDGGAGDDTIFFQALPPTTTDPDADTSRVDGGAGNDTITAFGIGGEVFGGEGDDQINGQGRLERLDGGDFNDTIEADSADYGGGTPEFGGEGDDLISLTNSPAFQIGAAADGGAGDDIIRTDTFLSGGTTFDTLTGGTGADRFELSFFDGAATDGSVDAGIVTTITDFAPGTDVLFIDGQFEMPSGGAPSTLDTVTLVETADGSFTDVVFTANADAQAATLTGTIRLLGTTGMSLDDIALREGSEFA